VHSPDVDDKQVTRGDSRLDCKMLVSSRANLKL